MFRRSMQRQLCRVAGTALLSWGVFGCGGQESLSMAPADGSAPIDQAAGVGAAGGTVDEGVADLATQQDPLFGIEREGNAPSDCSPEPSIPWDQMTPLQRHVAYFDWNGDGRITVGETYHGFRALGTNPLVSAAAALAINAALGTPTALFPSLTISIAGIDRGMHGSDTGVYDDFGNFDEERFAALFAQWDRNRDNALGPLELTQRTIKQIDLFDFVGPIASVGEFGFLYFLAADRDGTLSRDRLRAQYLGTLFYRLAADRGALGCRSVPG